ncbi:hypothetical protein CEXT_205691 [Caerostris extrusa]|uniref:Uncharacterized protein n=1 Tax=Caerostris extrusa TaxID=172846 RepID=A0AAV4W4Q5_CAEEX|nr:hypothetical protein CEXT_205691 [Caerostris extrusa]
MGEWGMWGGSPLRRPIDRACGGRVRGAPPCRAFKERALLESRSLLSVFDDLSLSLSLSLSSRLPFERIKKLFEFGKDYLYLEQENLSVSEYPYEPLNTFSV